MEISGYLALAAILKSSLFSTLYSLVFTLKVTLANLKLGLKYISQISKQAEFPAHKGIKSNRIMKYSCL